MRRRRRLGLELGHPERCVEREVDVVAEQQVARGAAAGRSARTGSRRPAPRRAARGSGRGRNAQLIVRPSTQWNARDALRLSDRARPRLGGASSSGVGEQLPVRRPAGSRRSTTARPRKSPVHARQVGRAERRQEESARPEPVVDTTRTAGREALGERGSGRRRRRPPPSEPGRSSTVREIGVVGSRHRELALARAAQLRRSRGRRLSAGSAPPASRVSAVPPPQPSSTHARSRGQAIEQLGAPARRGDRRVIWASSRPPTCRSSRRIPPRRAAERGSLTRPPPRAGAPLPRPARAPRPTCRRSRSRSRDDRRRGGRGGSSRPRRDTSPPGRRRRRASTALERRRSRVTRPVGQRPGRGGEEADRERLREARQGDVVGNVLAEREAERELDEVDADRVTNEVGHLAAGDPRRDLDDGHAAVGRRDQLRERDPVAEPERRRRLARPSARRARAGPSRSTPGRRGSSRRRSRSRPAAAGRRASASRGLAAARDDDPVHLRALDEPLEDRLARRATRRARSGGGDSRSSGRLDPEDAALAAGVGRLQHGREPDGLDRSAALGEARGRPRTAAAGRPPPRACGASRSCGSSGARPPSRSSAARAARSRRRRRAPPGRRRPSARRRPRAAARPPRPRRRRRSRRPPARRPAASPGASGLRSTATTRRPRSRAWAIARRWWRPAPTKRTLDTARC